MKKFVIDIYRIPNKVHKFDFEIGKSFFDNYDQDLVDEGALSAVVVLDKSDSFIGMEVSIKGTVNLICDRSLEVFQYPIDETHKVIFKYGPVEQELDHDVLMITNETQQIDVGQFIFEFIGLAVPMKKLHPRFNENVEELDSLVYQTEDEPADDLKDPDPRWSKLNELKKN